MKDVSNWLREFLTPAIEADLKRQGKFCIEANWPHWTDRTVKSLVEFNVQGEGFAIYRTEDKHQYCDAEFYTYYLGYQGQENEEYPAFNEWLSFGRVA
jgi:hypothetical protein